MLAEAIDSVLKQSLKDIEVIVVDDCSMDGTGDFVKSIPDERVRFLKNESNAGSEVSRNLGFRNSRGKYITFLDDDDYYMDYEFFARAAEIHERNKGELAIVCSDAVMLETDTGIKTPHSPGNPGRVRGVDFVLKQEKGYAKPLSLFPAVFSAEILRKAGFADMMILDSQTYMLAALYGDVCIMPGSIGVYRLHPESNTLGRKKNTAYNQRRYANLAERLKQNRHIKEELCRIEGAEAASTCFVVMTSNDLAFFANHSRGLADTMNIYRTLYANSDFPAGQWLRLFWKRLKHNIRTFMKKIPSLRKFYRFIKYGSEYV